MFGKTSLEVWWRKRRALYYFVIRAKFRFELATITPVGKEQLGKPFKSDIFFDTLEIRQTPLYTLWYTDLAYFLTVNFVLYVIYLFDINGMNFIPLFI